MRPQSAAVLVALMLAAALPLSGCGGGSDNGGFESCGNGVVDSGEECDDGNLIDTDGCLSTCTFNVCGDGVLNTGVEQCDRHQFGAATCTSLGFARGDLACTAQCTFDTSGCSGSGGTPISTPAQTPAGTPGTSSPGTSSSTTATPTVAPTPSGNLCQPGEQIVLVASLSKPYGGAIVDIGYPSDSVNIPGTGSATSVGDRVRFTATQAITAVDDHGTGGSAVDDTLTLTIAGTTEQPAGTFATVTFDCVTGATPPSVASFTCTVESASSPDGATFSDEQCSLSLS